MLFQVRPLRKKSTTFPAFQVLWGKTFRAAYDKVGQIRCVLCCPVLALSATAPTSIRKDLIASLHLTSLIIITTSLDRRNLFYSAFKAPSIDELESCFQWIISMLIEYKSDCPKMIIYCRNIASITMLLKFFVSKLPTDSMYINGVQNLYTSRFIMFSASTPGRSKKYIVEEFVKANSAVRIVCASIAFGMGFDAPDIAYVVHYGASRNLINFNQESGRAARSLSLRASSVLYYHCLDSNVPATDESMSLYCKNPDKKCLRMILNEKFQPDCKTVEFDFLHDCCSICHDMCRCGHCPDLKFIPSVSGRDVEMEVTPCYSFVNDLVRQTVLVNIQEYHNTISFDQFVNYEITSGFTNECILRIARDLEYIKCADDLIENEYVYEKTIASKIWRIIERYCVHNED